jgi:hypothetical protein
VFLATDNEAASALDATDADLHIGGGDGTSQGTASLIEADAVLNTEADSSTVTTKALRTLVPGATATVDGEADLDLAAVTNGFRLSWTDALAQASQICYLAVGSNPPGHVGLLVTNRWTWT